MKENYIIVKYRSYKTENLPSGSNVVDLGDKTYKIIIPDSARDLTAMFGCTMHMEEFAGFEPTNDVGFYSETDVEYIDMSQFDASNITNMSYMFFWNDVSEIRGTRNIVNPNCGTTKGMFMFCENLKTLDLFNMTIVASDEMFEYCSSLTSVTLGYYCNLLGHYAFNGCSSLNTLYVYRGAVATYVDTFYVKEQGTFYVPTGFITPSTTGKGWECLIGQFNWTKRTGLAINQFIVKYVVDDDDRLTFPLQLRVLGNISAISSMKFNGTSYTPSEFVTVSKPGTYSAVFTVDTSATSYADMFNDCMLYYESGSTKYPVGGLTEVNVVNLQACSKVTDFSRMFKNCRRLTSWLNLYKLCVSNATDLSEMFYGIGHTVEPIEVSGFEQWNVSKVENMSQMFRLSDFPITGLEDWNVSAVTNMSYMFEQTGVDKENGYPFPDLSKWNVSSVTDLSGTFQDTILSDLTMFSDWDVSSVTKLVSTFAETIITSTNGLEGWDVSKVTTMSMFFYWCKQLTDLTAIGNWDVSKVSNLSLAFTGCSALEDITPIVSWDITAETCDWMFGNCTSLKKANLSKWDLSSSQTSRLFKNCTSLEKVYLSEFPLVEREMFSNCTALDDIYMYAEVAPGKDTNVTDPFTNIKTYGTLHIKEGATGYRNEPWTTLYDVYYWNLQTGNTINIDVGPGGGTFDIEEVTTGNWTVSTYPSWLTLSAVSGTGDITFSIVVDSNISSSPRTATFYVDTSTERYTIVVTQEALSVEWRQQPYIFANNSGGTYANTIDFNLKPDSIVYIIPFADWVRVTGFDLRDTYSDSIIEIEAAGGDVARSAAISAELHYGDKTYIVTNDILQYSKNYTVSPSGTIEVPAEGGQVVITIESDYTLSNYTSVNASYGTVVFERLSDTKIQITIILERNDDNPISMVPVLKTENAGLKDINLVTITQSKFDLAWDFPTDPIYFDDDGGSVDINFTSYVDIENIIISNVPDWLTFTRSGNTITCIAAQNTSSQPRTATVSFEAEGYGITKQIVFTQEQVELSITRESYLYVYPADINGYVAKNVPVHITCNIWNTGYTWEISTFKEGYETDCKAVVDHYETSGNVASVYLNLFSLILHFHNAIINVKIKNGDEIVYEEDVNVKWPYVRSNGNVWHQDFGVSTGVVVNTMPRNREYVSIVAPATYGRIRGEYYKYDYQDINGTYVTGDLSNEWSLSLFDYVLIQAKTDNTTGKVRDVSGTFTMKNNEYNTENTVPITIRQVGSEKYTCIAEERIPYNKTCISFAYGGYMPYTFNIKADNYVKYIQFEDTQNWECYTAVLYGLEPNLTDQDKVIRIPYDVMNGTTVVESGEMVIIQETALTVSQTEILAPQQGGEYYIEVSAFGDWTIETSGAFFEVEPTSGSGDGGFLIKVYENPYVDMREGVVYVKTADETIEIKISQEGFAPWLYFGKEYIPVRRAGGLVRLMLYSNIRWTTEWVTL